MEPELFVEITSSFQFFHRKSCADFFDTRHLLGIPATIVCIKESFSFFIRTAKRLLTEIVEKGRPAPAFNHNDGPGMTVQEIMVPASKAGLVIGKGGETIKSLQVSVQFKKRKIGDTGVKCV